MVRTPEYSRNKIHPHKLTLWVGIGSIIMIFAALTSAFVVRRAAGNWLEFELEPIFFYNTLVILASSVTLHLSYTGFRNGQEQRYKLMLLLTMLLGLAFVVLQYMGWAAMTAKGLPITINPSASFVYVIPGVHAAHVLGGIVALVVATIHAYALPYKPVPHRLLRFELVVQYWHFVGVLWVYLIAFLALNF
jgi:cytochrome c oxidase subunit III